MKCRACFPLTWPFLHLCARAQKELASSLLRVELHSAFGFGAIAWGLFVVAGEVAMRGFREICLADETITVTAAAKEENSDCIEAILGDAGMFREKTKCIVGADPGLNSLFSRVTIGPTVSGPKNLRERLSSDPASMVDGGKGGGHLASPWDNQSWPRPQHPRTPSPPLLGNSRRFPPLLPITLRAAICLERC